MTSRGLPGFLRRTRRSDFGESSEDEAYFSSDNDDDNDNDDHDDNDNAVANNSDESISRHNKEEKYSTVVPSSSSLLDISNADAAETVKTAQCEAFPGFRKRTQKPTLEQT